jgi:hypothetical protein
VIPLSSNEECSLYGCRGLSNKGGTADIDYSSLSEHTVSEGIFTYQSLDETANKEKINQ